MTATYTQGDCIDVAWIAMQIRVQKYEMMVRYVIIYTSCICRYDAVI